jgi:hypothetical protein
LIRGRRRCLDRPDEAITPSRQRFDVARRVRLVAQRQAQFAHGHVQTIVEIHHALGPEHLHQTIARDHLSRIAQQLDQDAQGLLGESLHLAIAREFARVHAQMPPVEPDVRVLSHLRPIIFN